jgi:hypothetical protein
MKIDASDVIALLALLASGIALGQTWTHGRREHRRQQVDACGEALVRAQRVKNRLGDVIDLLEQLSSSTSPPAQQLAETQLPKLRAEYEQLWNKLSALEQLMVDVQRGGRWFIRSVDPIRISAQLWHLEQRLVLAEYDTGYLQTLLPKP